VREKEARQEEGERAIFINFHVVYWSDYWSDKMERDENKRREERKRKD